MSRLVLFAVSQRMCTGASRVKLICVKAVRGGGWRGRRQPLVNSPRAIGGMIPGGKEHKLGRFVRRKRERPGIETIGTAQNPPRFPFWWL